MARGRPIRARTAATIAAAAARKGTTRPGSKTHRKRERQAASAAKRAAGILPAPTTRAAAKLMSADPFRWIERTAENEFLRNASLSVTLDRRHRPGKDPNPYADELRQKVRAGYRAAYKAAGGVTARTTSRKPSPKKLGAWIRVKAHRRRRPGGRS